MDSQESQQNDPQNEPIEEAPPVRRRGERRYRFAPRKRRRFPQIRWWREALLGVLFFLAVLFLVNPFPRLAQASASVARPAEPLAVTPPQAPEEGYCLVGDFQEWNGRNLPLLDDGTEGDKTAGDNVYSRTVAFEESGRYLWRVLPCGNWNAAVPEKSAWVFVTAPNQSITFTFNPAMPPSRLWPRSYALTASDTLPARLVAVGSFQRDRWNNEDRQTEMSPAGGGQFELAYRVPTPGEYETYVAVQGRREGIGASGRSMEPVPLVFTTRFPAEMVVVQYDGRTDRIAVLYGIPWWLSWLSYSRGALVLAAVFGLSAIILGAQIGYRRIILRPDWQVGAGCPNCQQHALQRIHRVNSDYFLDLIGIPVRRYKCGHCGWKGRRIHTHHPHR